MATSGDFSTSNQYIKYRIIATENSYSIPNNTSSVTVQVQVWRTNSGYTTYGSGTCYCTINGTQYSQSITSNQKFTHNSNTQVFNTTVTIPHNADGSKTIYISSYISHDRFSSNSQGFNVTLTKIPRYATSNQSLSSKTETTIRMNWSSDSTVDYIWYSLNNGSSWTGVDVADGTSGSYTISGLAANTSYNIKTRVRRKDSQLTTDSSALSVTTYDYPKCTSAPNFTIGNKVTLGFYNPLGRNFTFYIIVNGTQISNSWTLSGTSYTGIDGSSSQSQLYATIPNLKSATYQVKVVYGSITKTTTGGTCSINESNCKPTISNVSYVDSKASTVAITGNNQQIIRNNSTLLFTLGTLTAKNSASLTKAEITLNGVTKSSNLSGTTASNTQINFGTVNISSNATATIKVTDSRGLYTTTTANITIIDWVLPTAIITLERQNNYYSTTYITANASYSSLNGNNTITIQYQYKKTTDGSYSTLATLTNNVQSQFEADNLYQWNVRVILTDRLGSTTYNLFLDKGMPIVYFDRLKSSTGFNCFPNGNETVETSGDIVTQGVPFNHTNTLIVSPTEPTGTDRKKLWLQKNNVNLFNKNNVIMGYTLDNNGTLLASSARFVSDYIRVKPNTQYRISSVGTTSLFVITEYTISKTFVTYTSAGSALSSVAGKNITTSNTTEYVKVSSMISKLDVIQFEQGTSSTTYDEFKNNMFALNGNGNYEDLKPTSVKEVENYFGERPTSANLVADGSGGLKTFKATSSMTEGKPPADAHIIHLNWDNTNGYDSQIAVKNGNSPKIWVRGMEGGTWGSWTETILKTDSGTRTITFSNNNFTNRGCFYRKIGNMVQLYIQLCAVSTYTPGNVEVICSNIPAPLENIQLALTDSNGGTNKRMRLYTNGNLAFYYSNGAIGQQDYYANIFYFTD